MKINYPLKFDIHSVNIDVHGLEIRTIQKSNYYHTHYYDNNE